MISVIIPSYNSETTIVPCLRAILNQDIEEPYEVIVVDSSVDQTPMLIKEHFPTVNLIHIDHRVDAGTARDTGVQNSHGDLISFVDSDCTVQPDYLQRVLENLSSEKYAAVGGPVINNGNPKSLISWAGYMIEFNQFLPEGKGKVEVNHIPTCNICYRREVFDRYGRFPSKEVLQQEDLLFNWRIQSQGEKILLDHAIPVPHHHRTKLKSYLHHQYEIGIGTVQVLRKTNLQGSTLVKYPILVTFLLPLLPLVKFGRTSFRFLRWDLSILWKRPFIFPLLWLGLLFWIVGFARGVYENSPSQKKMKKRGSNGKDVSLF